MSDLRLKVFASVARNLSFTRASHELLVSHPAITKHIKELESAYGVRLFERMGNKIALTDAGRILMQHCDRIIADYKALEFEMNLLRGVHKGELRLGASTTISQFILPPLLARFAERFPQVALSLVSGNSTFVEQQLHAHAIDLGLVEGSSHQPDLKYSHFMRDELVAVVAAKRLLNHRRNLAGTAHTHSSRSARAGIGNSRRNPQATCPAQNQALRPQRADAPRQHRKHQGIHRPLQRNGNRVDSLNCTRRGKRPFQNRRHQRPSVAAKPRIR